MKSLSTDKCSKGTEDQKATRESWTRVTSSKVVLTSCDSGSGSIGGGSGWVVYSASRVMETPFLFWNIYSLTYVSPSIGESFPNSLNMDFLNKCF